MKLQNNTKRDITFGLSVDEVLRKGEVVIVSDDVGKKLVKLYNGVVDLDNIKVTYDARKIKDFSTPKPKRGKVIKAKAAE